MYLSNHPIHFVVDSPNDCHYTDNLLRLGPEAFLWFELNRNEQAQLVLSVNLHDNALSVRTFDTASAALLQLKQSWFGTIKPLALSAVEGRTVERANRKLSELPQGSEFLEWLGDCAQSNSQYRIALLIAHDAAPALMQTGSIALPENCRVLLRLPADAEQLERCLLKEDRLRQAFPALDKALAYSSTTLMSALKLALNEQLVCLHDQPEDLKNLMLLYAARSGGCCTTEQLEDQARCLHLLRRHHRLYLLSDAFNDSPACYPQLFTLDGQLDGLHQRLMDRVRDLRKKYPGHTAAQALLLEGLVPRSSLDKGCDNDLEFCDHLADKLHRLRKELRSSQIPRDLRDEDRSYFASLTTLWNKPRSRVILESADDFCDSAFTAIAQKRWDDVKTALFLLLFCSNQVCAAQEQTENLTMVLRLGREVLSISENIAAAGRLNDTMMDMAVPMASSLSSVFAYQNKLHEAVMREDLNQEQQSLVTKRLLLQQKVNSFYRSDLTPEQQAADLAEIQRGYDQTIDQAMQSREAAKRSAQNADRKAEQMAPKSEPVVIRKSVAAPMPEPVQSTDTRQNSYEDDVRTCRELLYNSGMPGGYISSAEEDEFDEDDLYVEEAT